ncbi:MAG: phosphoribosyl-AMP cyclohydrolase [Candidatus Thermoplasmatota archaeon]|nr:phosphoribosyl-AMP cyclohydrolase [Candidatus Thermoplasmatota archaeon]
MVSLEDVERAQQEWGDGIVAISEAYRNGGDYVEIATYHINTLYAYQIGPVMFKPTLAAVEQFRPTFESALSYFVASNNACPEDEGFAIKGWTKVRFENDKVTTDGNRAFAMGNYFFTDAEGSEIKVEYTFGYIEDQDKNLRIQLHHSSMPAARN